MLSSSQLRALNRRFGQEFGFNPHGQPFFRWTRTEAMSYFIDHGPGWITRPSGLLSYDKKFQRRSWADRYGRCWILCKWRHYTEDEWQRMVGNTMPYPRNGDWVPVENIRLGPEYPDHPHEPNLDATLDAISAIRMDRLRTSRPTFAAEDEQALADEYQRTIQSIKNRVGDELHDLTPAMGKDPGTHSGATEFMSHNKGETSLIWVPQ